MEEQIASVNSTTKQHVRALLQLGWTHQRIARELKVATELVLRYASLKRDASASTDLHSGQSVKDDRVEQLRPLARVLLIQARRSLARQSLANPLDARLT